MKKVYEVKPELRIVLTSEEQRRLFEFEDKDNRLAMMYLVGLLMADTSKGGIYIGGTEPYCTVLYRTRYRCNQVSSTRYLGGSYD